jgi:hypothetical protein
MIPQQKSPLIREPVGDTGKTAITTPHRSQANQKSA